MKRIIKLALVGALVLACGSSAAYAQKFGYINKQDIVALLAERDSVETKLNLLSEDLRSQLEFIQVEFNNKVADLQKNSAGYSEAVRQIRNQELQDLQARYQQREQLAQQELQVTYESLITPLVERADNAIKKVGTDGVYLAIFDNSVGSLAYFNEKSMTDVTDAVKKQLGLK